MSLFAAGTTDYDPSVLLPNRYNDLLKVVVARCPCGDSANVREGVLGTHFPPMYNGCALKDPFLPGTSACRYSGRTVTTEAAQRRDAELSKAERTVRNRLRESPGAWLGLLEWVALEDVKVGDRVGFTQVERTDPYESPVAYERQGVVKRRGKTFALITCDEDGLAGEVRLTAKAWRGARVRRK